MGVFISYSNQDEDVVQALATDLRRVRQTVWLDQELHGGDTWWQTILKQIQDADVFVFALSTNSQRSKPCRAELEYARALGIPVLPVQIGPLEGLRSATIADLQIVDYRQRNADAALGLIAAVHEAKLRRGPLPEPLPDQPPIPFEYLMVLGRAIDAPHMNPSEQVGVLAQLRQGLEDEDDANARRDIAMLLQNMRRRPDATYRSVSEIDTLLATIDQAPPPEPQSPGQTFPSHGVSADRYPLADAATDVKQVHSGTKETRKAGRRTVSSWFSDLVERRYEGQTRREAEKQRHATETQTSIDLTDSLGLGQVTRRWIVLAASTVAVIILLVVVLVIVNTPSGIARGPWAVSVSGGAVDVYQSPSRAAPKVGSLQGGTKVAIQCTAQGDKVGGSSVWYRIENGYIADFGVYFVTDNRTVPSC